MFLAHSLPADVEGSRDQLSQLGPPQITDLVQNKCWVKPLSLGIVCYTAKDNQNSGFNVISLKPEN